MTAIERLTKQNHDLEEQLRQRDAGPNLQEQNQESNSAERREQERPEGNNAPSRPERQNVSLPSLMDFAPPPIIAEMQVMKEQMEVMMNALKGWVSSDLDDLVNRTDSPFTASVNTFPLPQKFPDAADRKLRRGQGSTRSSRDLQDPDAPSGGTRRDDV